MGCPRKAGFSPPWPIEVRPTKSHLSPLLDFGKAVEIIL